jgi:hypothetical protein
MFKRSAKRLKSWNTIDHWIDLIVDIGLIIFDVLTSPILIMVRILRNTINRFLKGYLKSFLKWITHKLINILVKIKHNLFR